MVAGVVKNCLLNQTFTLFQAESATTIQAGTAFPFNLPFPEYSSSDDLPLPPSCSVFHPGAAAEVLYTVQIDIVRGTFYRHEM